MPQANPRATGAPTTSPSATAPAAETLQSVRAQIDAIDGSILGLVMARQALSARAAAGKAPSDMLKIRPDRESEVIRRLQVLGQGFSPGLIERLWRELLSDGLHRQSPFRLMTWAGSGHEADLVEAARQRFGCGPQMSLLAEPKDALDIAAAGCDVAIMDLAGEWWAQTPQRWPELKAFAVLASPAGELIGLALARLEAGVLDGEPAISVRSAPPTDPATLILAQSPTHWLCLEAAPQQDAAVLGAACGWTSEPSQ